MFKRLSRRNLAIACLSMSFCLLTQASYAEVKPWLKSNSEGKESLIQSNYGQAERSFLKALGEAEKDDHALADQALIAKNLGDLYTVRGQFSKAQPYYERSLKLKCQVAGVDDEDVISSFGQLAQFYMAHAQQLKADSICARLVHDANTIFQEKVILSKSQKVSAPLDATEKTQPVSENADLCRVNNECLDLAAIFDSLGTAYKGQHKYLQAESLFKPALALREKILSSTHMAVAASCEHLAGLYAAQSKYAQAEPLFKQSYEIAKSMPGPKRPELTNFTISLADCYMNMGKNNEALTYFQEALANCSANSMAQCDVKLALAHFYERTGRCSQAALLMKQALVIAEKANGPNHASLSPILDDYSEVLNKLNRNSEAANVSSRAKYIRGM